MNSLPATCAPQPSPEAETAQRRIRLVLNPIAGRRREALATAVIERLRGRNRDIELQVTGGPGHASAMAEAAARRALNGETKELLVIAGGDGTINEAINGLVAAGGQVAAGALPLAIIPLGTANVLAHEIGLQTKAEAIAEAIAQGRIGRVSLGRTTAEGRSSRCFTLMAGVGFDAHVVENVDLALKKRIGKGAYVWESLRQIAGFAFPSYRVTIDGQRHEASSVIVANARSYAGPFVAAPDASLLEPGFQVLLFKRGGALAVTRSALALFRNAMHRLPDVTLVQGRSLRIEGPAGDPVQGDGDTLTRLPVDIEALPDAFDLVLPAAP